MSHAPAGLDKPKALLLYVRASPHKANGAGNKAPVRPRTAQVAQLVEHMTENHGVGGSIPPLGTIQRRRRVERGERLVRFPPLSPQRHSGVRQQPGRLPAARRLIGVSKPELPTAAQIGIRSYAFTATKV